MLIASHQSDEALLLNPADGKIVFRFDVSTFKRIPGSLPYSTVITNDGKRGYVSLWNASTVAELDLLRGKVLRKIALGKPKSPTAGGSHPTALLLNRARDRHAVGVLADTDNREQHHQLEIPQPFTAHFINYTELMAATQAEHIATPLIWLRERVRETRDSPAHSPSSLPPWRRPCSTRP